MKTASYVGDPDQLSRPELISLYINGYYTLDADSRSKFEAAFRKRKLPLPSMPEKAPSQDRPGSRKPCTIDRSTFISYMLLIYSGTAIFYSWIFLATRLVKMDLNLTSKHKLIQSGIALVYIVAEILLYDYFSKIE